MSNRRQKPIHPTEFQPSARPFRGAQARAKKLRAAGKAWPAVAERLNAEGFRTKTGRPWSAENVLRAVARYNQPRKKRDKLPPKAELPKPVDRKAELRKAGFTLREVADQLNRERFQADDGRPWSYHVAGGCLTRMESSVAFAADPTPEEIERRKAEIQGRWSPEERAKRWAAAHSPGGGIGSMVFRKGGAA